MKQSEITCEYGVLRTVRFFVPGVPRPKGSARYIARGGRAVHAPTKAEKSAKNFAATVSFAAHQSWGGPPTGNPVRLICVYQFPRPKTHFHRAKGVLVMRDDAPTFYAKTPDICKVDRRLHDALTGIVYDDDKRIVGKETWMYYADLPGVHVTIEELQEL